MKRGLITWNKSEIPESVFEDRAERARAAARSLDIPVIAIYSDLWRSNHSRFMTNFIPYFNRALLLIPAAQPPVLLCGLTPRTYPWIRSVTTIEDIRPAGNFFQPLEALAEERGWTRIGVVELNRLPADISRNLHRTRMAITNVDPAEIGVAAVDDFDLSLKVKAIEMARVVLKEELPAGIGKVDHAIVSRLEKRFRAAGAGDLVVLVSDGRSAPRTARGSILGSRFSVSIALEYQGHWVRISRPQAPALAECRAAFQRALTEHNTGTGNTWVEDLGDSYPYRCVPRSELRAGSIFALHVEVPGKDGRVFYGDMCRVDPSGIRLLGAEAE